MNQQLADFKVLTFDCYGTLIDWESGIWDALQPLLMHNHCQSVDRNLGLQAFATQETEQERATPGMLYPQLLTQVHRAIAGHLGLQSNDELDDAFGCSVPLWPAFAEKDLDAALLWYANRQRRFGRTGEQVEQQKGA